MPRKPRQDPDLLKEIRDNYDWALDYWREIHREGNADVKFIAGDPWDPKDVAAREALEQKRPHLVFDEGSQYLNMFGGQARQQKRSPKVEPVDERVDSETATVMQERMYHIEYVSRGQAHNIKGLMDAASRGYGWISLRKRYSTERGREQEPCWNPVANPDSRLMDPNAKEPDGSDMEFCFVHDPVKKSYVKSKWPWAKNLGGDDVKEIILTEYWKVRKQPVDCCYLLEDGSENGMEVYESELGPNAEISETHVNGLPITDEREIEESQVTKYICQIIGPEMAERTDAASPADSVEILEEEPWDGKYIPEIPVFGQQYYTNENGKVKCVYLSMLRRARDPMQLLNLTRSNEAELVSMTPKTRFLGYEGQFEGHEDEFKNIGTSPLAYLQVRPVADPVTNQILPLPEAIRWEPPIQALELLAQSCQNAIRSAVGQLASPELDKTKSGVALEKIRQGGESAVYHILDNYERALEQVGRVMGDLLERTHDSTRKEMVRNAAGESRLVTFNAPYDNEKGQRRHHKIIPGAFAYTISTGPSYQSQFEQASEFIDILVGKVPELLIDGQGHTVFGDLFVKLKNMGPIGDQIMERFKKLLRPELQEQEVEIPPQVLAEMQKAQKVIDFLAEKVNHLQDVLESKMLELQSEERRNETDNKTKLAIAEINAQVKENIEQLTTSMDQIALKMNQQFEAMMAKMEHEHALELGEQTNQNAMAQAEQQAALQPTEDRKPSA